MSNRAERVKAILRDPDISIGTNTENEQKLKKFLYDNGYKCINNINFIKG